MYFCETCLVMNIVIWEMFNTLYSLKLPVPDIIQSHTCFSHSFVLPTLAALLMVYFMMVIVSARLPPLVASPVNNEL